MHLFQDLFWVFPQKVNQVSHDLFEAIISCQKVVPSSNKAFVVIIVNPNVKISRTKRQLLFDVLKN